MKKSNYGKFAIIRIYVERFRRLFAKKTPIFNSVPPTFSSKKIIDSSTVEISIA
jgi:hypothetical protein